MNFKPSCQAFSRSDLLVTLGVVFLLGALGYVFVRKKSQAQASVVCQKNLKEITLALKMWPPGSDDIPPWKGIGAGTSSAYTNSGTVLPHYQALSNQWLQNPKILTCPADNRSVSLNWSTLNDSNISYFINFDTDSTHPMRIAFGDRRLTSTVAPQNNLLVLNKNTSYSWEYWIHARLGSLSYSDGSVRSLTTKELTPEFHSQENLGSRLQLPR
jgi:hypothetical protein